MPIHCIFFLSKCPSSPLLFFLARLFGLAFAIALAMATRAADAASAPESLAADQELRGRFEQDRSLAGFSKPLHSEGSFVLAPGDGLIWNGEKPFSSTSVVTPGGVLQMSGGEEAMRIPTAQVPGLSQLYDILGGALSGNLAELQKAFTIARDDDAEHWRMVLQPIRHGALSLEQIKSLTLSGGRFVEAVQFEMANGDGDVIRFEDQHIEAQKLSAQEKALFAAVAK
jgi:hypothetical protein